MPVQLEAITCLAQFYDPPLRCFTFKDFQLAPTLEELVLILKSSKELKGVYTDIGRIPEISDLASFLEVPNLPSFYKGDGDVQGFNQTNLEFLAHKMVEGKRWVNLEDTLAFLIFGLVLFPNLENFIDNAALRVFWSARIFDKDYVSAFLVDIYYTLEVRYSKRRGLMLCCIPFLYQWFSAQIFPKSSVVKTMDRGEWTNKIASLGEQSICWYAFKTQRDEAITSCGSFTNVPLIGSRGCISYNPLLALRQIGFPLFVRPNEDSLIGFVIHDIVRDVELLIQVIKAWEKVHTKGSELRVCIGQRAKSYKKWMQERVEMIKLPFMVEESTPLFLLVPTPPVVSFEEANALRAKILLLEQEKEEVEASLHKSTYEKNKLVWSL